jgi:hypothetical protein
LALLPLVTPGHGMLARAENCTPDAASHSGTP